MGGDAIFMWKLLSSGTPPDSPNPSEKVVVIGREKGKTLRKSAFERDGILATFEES